MPSAVEHLNVLAATGRPAGSEAEAVARRYAQAQLTASGFAVTEEAFEYSAFPGRMATPAVGVALGVTLVATAAAALLDSERLSVALLVSGLLATLAFVRRMLGTGVLDVPWMRRKGVNVVATRGSAAPSVWLVAHLDSKSQPIPSAVRVIGVAVVASVVVLAMVAAGLMLAGAAPRALWWIVLAGGLAGSLPVIASVVGNRSDGAVDNASGVAAVLSAAALVRPNVPFGVLLPSAEELGLTGARAFVRGRAPAIALNCDGVDDDGALVIMHNGVAPARIVAAVTDAAGDNTTARARRMPLGLLTDSTAFHDAGWKAVTVSYGSLATLRRVHTSRDSLATLKGTRLDEVGRVLAAAVMRLASDEG